jgi:molybdate transport system substrate-binding protein
MVTWNKKRKFQAPLAVAALRLGQPDAARVCSIRQPEVSRMKSFASALAKLVAAVAMLGMASAQAAEVKLIAAAEMRALLALLPAFEKSSGHKVNIIWEIETTTRQVVEREKADAVLIPVTDLDKLMAADMMLAGSRVDVAKSPLGLAVREGDPKPDISSAEAVKKAILAAKSVVYSTGPSGTHLAEMFEKMRIAEQIKDKIVRKGHHQRVTHWLMARNADLGFDVVSELTSEGENGPLQYVGPLPPDMQYVTVFAAAIRKTAASPDAAKALLQFLTTPEAASVIKQFGMEPG